MSNNCSSGIGDVSKIPTVGYYRAVQIVAPRAVETHRLANHRPPGEEKYTRKGRNIAHSRANEPIEHVVNKAIPITVAKGLSPRIPQLDLHQVEHRTTLRSDCESNNGQDPISRDPRGDSGPRGGNHYHSSRVVYHQNRCEDLIPSVARQEGSD